MSLMDRIKITSFLSMDPLTRLNFIKELQAKRSNALALSKVKPIRATKAPKATKLKVKDPIAEAAKLFKGLSPAQIKSIKESYGIK